MDFDLGECNNHIDMKKAYANYKMCKYYDGFLGNQPTSVHVIKWKVLDIIEFKTYNLTIAF